MGLFGSFMPADINAGVREFRETPGAKLVDVRTPAEFADGHIPGAVNVPLQQLGSITAVAPQTATPLFVYCLSGGRSSQAAAALKRAGYADVRNIGGIGNWNGEVER